MSPYVKVTAAALSLACVIISSCASFRANYYLVQEITPQQKSAILFNQALSRYNDEIVDRQDYTNSDKIRTLFQDAVALDPLNAQAQQYLDELNANKDTLFDSNKEKATTLYATQNRTPDQDYDLVYAVKMASDINKSDKDLSTISQGTKSIRISVIKAREEQLVALQKKIAEEKSQTELLKEMRDANKLIGDLTKIDPANKGAEEAREYIAKANEQLVQNDIDAAKASLTAKKYSDAETTVLQAEKRLTALSQNPTPQLISIKYQVYYQWAFSLFNAKKYPTATDRVNSAIKVSRTQEAIGLKDKIAKAAANRDYDADIDGIVASVDAFISKGDAAGAMDAINANLAKLKVKANKDKLSAKVADVKAILKTAYQEGIKLYNEEDYEGAKAKFQIVVRVDPAYEQAQGYLDKSETKIRALKGSN